jgi:multidrug efflux system membrane fusion protein
MKKTIVAAAVIASVAGAAVLLKPGAKVEAPKGPAAVPVLVAEARQTSMPVELRTIGTVSPTIVSVKSRMDAQITGVHFNDGDEVKAGQLLFTLDERAPRAAIAQAEALLAKDRATLANAKRDMARYAELAGKGFASKQKFDEASTTAQVAEAAVKVDEAQLSNAKLQLTYTRIEAPMDGRTGTVQLPPGNMARATDSPLVIIRRTRPIQVTFNLPQTELPGIREAQGLGPVPVEVEVPGDRKGRIKGQLLFLENTVDVATGTILIWAIFPNDDQRLWPGQLVNVSMRLRDDPSALVVPATSVQSGQNGTFVFVVRPDQTAEVRAVTLARSLDNTAVIASGLQPGETVVVDGQFRLAPGVRVEPRRNDGQTKAEAPQK